MIKYSKECLKAFARRRKLYVKFIHHGDQQALKEYELQTRIVELMMREESDNYFRSLRPHHTFVKRRQGS